MLHQSKTKDAKGSWSVIAKREFDSTATMMAVATHCSETRSADRRFVLAEKFACVASVDEAVASEILKIEGRQ